MSNYAIADGILFEDFDSLTPWTASGSGSGSIAQDTTNVKTGTGSLLISAFNGNEAATRTIALPGTATGLFGYWAYIVDITTVFGLTIYLSSSSSFTSNFSYQVLAGRLRTGWNFISIDQASWTNTGSESWSNTFIRMRVRVDTLANLTAKVSFDSLYYGFSAKPKVVIMFDDGRDSSYSQGYNYMQKYGMPGTIGVNSANVGTTGWATLAQLQEMYSAGWDMANHTTDHSDLTTLSVSQQVTKITGVITYLQTNGFDLNRGAYFLVYPFGLYNTDSITASQQAGMILSRALFTANQAMIKGIDNPYQLRSKELAQSVSLATAKTYIDDVIAKNETLFLFCHKIVASPSVSTEWPITDFQAIIDYIQTYRAAGSLDVMTISRWYNGLTTVPSKHPTLWAAKDGTSSVTPDSGDLLLESASYLLLESGFKLVLEDVIVTPKESSTWDASAAKADSQWSAKDGSSIITLANANVIRVQQNGTDIRVMQNGTDVRILNESVVIPKIPATWDNL